ncbi:hypothetical protein U9M48_004112 [Paspalum notatum var. saurae]|uniref:DUF4218 domain-containing protein n=1 Tax=Paspalum notatum var. saurae TaxID=547442 RepID=A0AAQ3PN06_PASNO
MYPVERRLLTLKRYVRNKARPEDSIAEAYVAEESLTFCSKYMTDVETRYNRSPRNKGFSDESVFGVDVFGHGVNLIGGCQLTYCEKFDQLIFYVRNNCAPVEEYVGLFKSQLQEDGVAEAHIDTRFRQGFVTWFRNHIFCRSPTEMIDDDLRALACGPDLRVRLYCTCVVNGVRRMRKKNKRSQNSGLSCMGTHNNKDIDFYGTLKEIIELQYNNKEDGTPRSVVLFRCDWYKLDGKRIALKDDGFFKSVNTGSLWYNNDSFILATQARQVFYLPDTKFGKGWQVVQTFGHRHLFNVSEIDLGARAEIVPPTA